MLKRLKTVVDSEGYESSPDGFEALIFTAEGDMRYALNNL
jgi:DNA polymerase III delta prime subunit